LGTFPVTTDKKRYIIVLADKITNALCAIDALKSDTATETSEFFVMKALLCHVLMQCLQADNGTNYASEMVHVVVTAFCKRAHKTWSTFRPQSQGIAERLDHPISEMLSIYVNSDQKKMG
jgi:hypothetical protein